MKTLFLVRHAKSSWNDPDLADFDRPLNDRGRDTAPFMGHVMRREGFIPDVVISSPAERAMQTAKLICDSAHFEAETRFDERIYEASPRMLSDVVSEIDDANGSALLIGHNPGMEGLIKFLTGTEQTMPTAALAVVDLDIDTWRDTGSGAGRLRKVVHPKEEMRRQDATNA